VRTEQDNLETVKGPYPLREGWAWVSLRDLCSKPQYGYTASAIKEHVGPKLLRITNIQNGKVDWENVPYCRIGIAEIPKYEIEQDDIFFARTGATTGKSYLIAEVPERSVFASYLIRIKVNKELVDPKYLYLFFQSSRYWAQIVPQGGAQPNMNAQKLVKLRVAVPFRNGKPDVHEQKRIVARIEEVFSKLDRIRELRQQAKQEAEDLLAAALHKVFSQSEEKGWRKVKLRELVGEAKSGFACSKSFEEEIGIPHLRPNNIGFGRLDLESLVYLPQEFVDVHKYSLQAGDILFNNTNSKELVGRATLVQENLTCGFSNHITRLRLKADGGEPGWVVYAINELWIRGYFLRMATKWIG